MLLNLRSWTALKAVSSKSLNYFRKGDFRLFRNSCFQKSFNTYILCYRRHFPISPLVFDVFVFQTGEKLYELRGHTHKITAIAPLSSSDGTEEKTDLIITASADRTVIVSFGLERI